MSTLTDRTEDATGTGDGAHIDVRAAVLTRVVRRDQPGHPGSSHALLGVRQVSIGRGDATDIDRAGDTLTLRIADRRASGTHARLHLHNRAWLLTDLGSTNGTALNGSRVAPNQAHTLNDGDRIELGQTTFMLRLDQPVNPVEAPLDLDVPAATIAPGWATFHRPLRAAYQRALRLAPSAQNILIRGVTGSGKERVAQGIHAASQRPGACVACNCATLPAGLIESTLFGHAAGAFTGAATARDGLFRAAHRGTLFLDEVGALPAAAQASLLRVLETGAVRPVGQDRPIAVDVRVVAATLDDLDRPDFRADLRMRLAQSTIELPGLTARREDFGLIMAAHLGGAPIVFDGPAMDALLGYAWPGNIRELVNLLGELKIIAEWRGGRVGVADLPAWATATASAPTEDDDSQRVRDALRQHGGNVKAAAAWMGLSRQQLYVLIRRHGVDVNRFRS
ncbi:MAG: hypothetical protein ACI9U2_001172 [Bradymonadia bacterium]|jgi:hypothetical protein